ncbi:Nodule Cysteine-Rich (NCR) secreted peptide [Medicago truncatula]|uniref:Nodule Cysteine-Rich (NCR) secreted peptide n=1 Tax=Medicago truncatula TaxID=3880 RepID=A0A072VCR5_MEDTR|nr:Nodule Cysteine-Rich (NCR) secreted peptide [Medicago truncatula]
MAKTLKFVYIILFMYIFHVSKNVEAFIDCETVADCPTHWAYIYVCEKNKCRYHFKSGRVRPDHQKNRHNRV